MADMIVRGHIQRMLYRRLCEPRIPPKGTDLAALTGAISRSPRLIHHGQHSYSCRVALRESSGRERQEDEQYSQERGVFCDMPHNI